MSLKLVQYIWHNDIKILALILRRIIDNTGNDRYGSITNKIKKPAVETTGLKFRNTSPQIMIIRGSICS